MNATQTMLISTLFLEMAYDICWAQNFIFDIIKKSQGRCAHCVCKKCGKNITVLLWQLFRECNVKVAQTFLRRLRLAQRGPKYGYNYVLSNESNQNFRKYHLNKLPGTT